MPKKWQKLPRWQKKLKFGAKNLDKCSKYDQNMAKIAQMAEKTQIWGQKMAKKWPKLPRRQKQTSDLWPKIETNVLKIGQIGTKVRPKMAKFGLKLGQKVGQNRQILLSADVFTTS